MHTFVRILAVFMAACISLVMAAGPSVAANPHFIKAEAELSGFDLEVSFKEVGLGSNVNIDFIASAHYDAVFQCVNRGGKNPSAANKSEESGTQTEPASFSSGKNGNIVATITIPAPSTATNDLVCPNGQREQLSMITWTDVSLVDLTNNVSVHFSGVFTAGAVI